MNDCLLLIFVKNPVLGTVKTRLAKDIGAEKALEIYLRLLEYTSRLAQQVDCDRTVFYSGPILKEDVFEIEFFRKELQTGENLGEKMKRAFQWAFGQGYKRVLIVGSDCKELEKQHLEAAFESLKTNRFVIGPAKDGGYYLLGMNTFEPGIFDNKNWSTATVFPDTIADFEKSGAAYKTLPVLSDVDYVADLGDWLISS